MTKKPNTFSLQSLLSGDEELYSQTGGTNTKFLVSDIWQSQPYVEVNSGSTYEISGETNIYGTNSVINNVNSGSTINLYDANIQSGVSSELVDNGDGTYFFQNGNITGSVISIHPSDYKIMGTYNPTGEDWVDAKQIIRTYVELPQWTIGNEGQKGSILLAGADVEHVTRLSVFAKKFGGGNYSVVNINTGDGQAWKAAASITNDTGQPYIVWEDLLSSTFILAETPIVYFIVEFTYL